MAVITPQTTENKYNNSMKKSSKITLCSLLGVLGAVVLSVAIGVPVALTSKQHTTPVSPASPASPVGPDVVMLGADVFGVYNYYVDISNDEYFYVSADNSLHLFDSDLHQVWNEKIGTEQWITYDTKVLSDHGKTLLNYDPSKVVPSTKAHGLGSEAHGLGGIRRL